MKLIPLTQGLFAKVDDSDFCWLNKWKWYACKSRNTFYARREVTGMHGQEHIQMHKQILGIPRCVKCDHRNGDGLDNQRSNLRSASHSQNCRNRRIHKNNTTGFKGVYRVRGRLGSPVRSGKPWKALIMVDRRSIYLGVFETPELAAEAYDRAALEFHGQFSRPNFKARQ